MKKIRKSKLPWYTCKRCGGVLETVKTEIDNSNRCVAGERYKIQLKCRDCKKYN